MTRSLRARIIFLGGLALVAPPTLARVAPGVLTESSALTLGVAACFAAMALSTYVVVGQARRLSLGHGALAGFGAFASGLLTARGPQVPFVVGLIVAAAAGALGGSILGLMSRRLRGVWLAVATLAFSLAMDQSLFRSRLFTGGTPGLDVPRPRIGSFVFSRNADYLSLAILILLVLLWLESNLSNSDLGRAIRAAGGDDVTGSAFGIDPARTINRAFIISGAFVGVSGALFGHLLGHVRAEAFSPELLSIPLLAIVAIGGTKRRIGVLIAASAYAIVPWLLGTADAWEPAIVAGILLVVLSTNRDKVAAFVRKLTLRSALEPNLDTDIALADARVLASLVAATSLPSLDVVDLSVRVGRETILDDVTFSVSAGSTLAIVGANGAGKTEILDAVCGLSKGYEGDIRLGERSLDGLSFHRRSSLGIARTFEQVGLVGSMSVADNLLLAQHRVLERGSLASLLRRDRRAVDSTHEAADVLGLGSRLGHPVDDLSYGQRRLLEIACAVLSGAGLILLDEPSSGLDDQARRAVRALIQGLRSTRTIILVEHDTALAAAVSDRICVISRGRLLEGSAQGGNQV